MNIALVLAGGTGSRLGADMPKQYLKVKDKMIITYCLETLCQSPHIDAVVIVAEPMWQDVIAEAIPDQAKFRGFALPGANRQLSIYSGLKHIEEFANRDSKILVHDAARPLLSEQLIARIFAAYEGHDGVMPVLPMKDTVYMSEDGKVISSLLKRENIFAGQAPELFHFGRYYDACKALLPDRILSINGSTEPAILAGMDIAMVDGDEGNFKITTQADLDRFNDWSE